MDVLHDAFPRIENYQIVNYLLTTCVVYTVTGFALQSPDWSTRLTLLRRWTFLLGLLYIFRGLTLFVTTLPSSLLDECRPPETELTGTVGERFGFIYNVVAGSALGCTDNIFSGHTSVMMSCVILWRVHSRMRRVFSWLLYGLAFSGITMIILSRFHYTIDVLLALCNLFLFCVCDDRLIMLYSHYLYDMECLFTIHQRSIHALHVWFHKICFTRSLSIHHDRWSTNLSIPQLATLFIRSRLDHVSLCLCGWIRYPSSVDGCIG